MIAIDADSSGGLVGGGGGGGHKELFTSPSVSDVPFVNHHGIILI